MYIKINGKQIDVYENGRHLSREEAIDLITQNLELADEPEAINILTDSLILLENERGYLS